MKYNMHIYLHGISLWSLQVYSVNKSCSIIFQLHMLPDYVSIVYWVICWHRLGKMNWCQTWLGNTQEAWISVCIVHTAIVCWHFHTLYWNNILEPGGDCVI